MNQAIYAEILPCALTNLQIKELHKNILLHKHEEDAFWKYDDWVNYNKKEIKELKLSDSLYYKTIDFLNKMFSPMSRYDVIFYDRIIELVEDISNIEHYLPNDDFEFVYMSGLSLLGFSIKDDGLVYAFENVDNKTTIRLISSGKWL